MKKEIRTDGAPAAVGPYSQGIATDSLVFVSGQVPMDPATGTIIEGSIEEQTKQVLKNIAAVLKAAGCTMEDVVRCDVFLKDMNDFKIVNEIYAEAFNFDPKPARQAVEVARLPMDVQVEISCIAVKK